ncbi:MAG: TMEM175 family protein [Candidatus Paceibacteria bacterium]
MQNGRLSTLADGIFAIVMTLLVFEMRLPNLPPGVSSEMLLTYLRPLLPALGSYVLTFTLLFTYWKAHHFFVSVYAKNIDSRLTNINVLFLMLIALVPFSSTLLSRYSENQAAISIFGLHIILVGLTLYWMRRYVLFSSHIKNPEITEHEIRGSTVRTLVPVLFALIAIGLAFWHPKVSVYIFTLAVLFNLTHWSTVFFERVFFRKKIPTSN